MLLVDITTNIAAPPMKVWRAICDFETYSRWNPYREIVGVPGLGEEVVLKIGAERAARRSLRARITAFEPGQLIEFTSGRSFLVCAQERFELERSARGCWLRHSAHADGIAAGIATRLTSKTELRRVYECVDDALAHFIAPGLQPKRRS